MQYYLFPPAIALHSLYSHVALPPTPETNSLSLHDALPIYRGPHPGRDRAGCVLEGHDVPLDARHGADQTRGRDDLLAGLERVLELDLLHLLAPRLPRGEEHEDEQDGEQQDEGFHVGTLQGW